MLRSGKYPYLGLVKGLEKPSDDNMTIYFDCSVLLLIGLDEAERKYCCFQVP